MQFPIEFVHGIVRKSYWCLCFGRCIIFRLLFYSPPQTPMTLPPLGFRIQHLFGGHSSRLMIIILLVQQRQPPLVLTTTSPFLKIIIYPANGLLSYGVSPLNIFRNIVTQVHKFMNPLPTSYAVYNLHKLLIAHLAPHVPSFREREILPTYGKLELNKIRPSEISFRLSILRAFAIPFSEHIQNPTK